MSQRAGPASALLLLLLPSAASVPAAALTSTALNLVGSLSHSLAAGAWEGLPLPVHYFYPCSPWYHRSAPHGSEPGCLFQSLSASDPCMGINGLPVAHVMGLNRTASSACATATVTAPNCAPAGSRRRLARWPSLSPSTCSPPGSRTHSRLPTLTPSSESRAQGLGFRV